MTGAPDTVDPRYHTAFVSAQALTEQQARAAVEIASRLPASAGEAGLVGALTLAFATNFAAINNVKAR